MYKLQSCNVRKNQNKKCQSFKKIYIWGLRFSNKGHRVFPTLPGLSVFSPAPSSIVYVTSMQEKQFVGSDYSHELRKPTLCIQGEEPEAVIGSSGKFYKCGKINRDNSLVELKQLGITAGCEQCIDLELLPDGRNSNTRLWLTERSLGLEKDGYSTV